MFPASNARLSFDLPVWIKSYWTYPAMAWFRYSLCEPRDTFNSLCAMPDFPDKTEEEQWCLDQYSSTECSKIRNAAQSKAERYILWFYAANGVWALVAISISYLVLQTLQNMISPSLVQKSREGNIGLWLSIPTLGSAAVGIALAWAKTSALNVDEGEAKGRWIGPMYIAASSLFALASLLSLLIARLSIYNTAQKWRKFLAIFCFIIVSVLLVVFLVIIFVGSIYLSSYLRGATVPDNARGSFACAVDKGRSCTMCDASSGQCPEWTSNDVLRVLRSQTKASASLSGIYLIYTWKIIQFGVNLWKVNQSYQIGFA